MKPRSALLVDDNAGALQTMRVVLEANGFRVDAASTVEAARGQLRSHVPTLVLADTRLTDNTGQPAHRLLREDPRLSGVPIVALAAYAMAMDQQGPACDALLTKPIDTRALGALALRMTTEHN